MRILRRARTATPGATEPSAASPEEGLRAVAPAVVAVTRALLGSRHPELDDVAQEALLAVYDAIRRFRGESSLLHYARRIAVRTALAARRRSPRHEPMSASAFDAADGSEAAPDRIARELRVAAFRALLDQLPPEQAESLAMRAVLGYDLPQIAAETGVPINTVRSRIRLARERLRAWIVGDPRLADLFEVEP